MATKTSKYIETVNYHYAKRALSLSALESILNNGQELLSKSQWTPLRNFGIAQHFLSVSRGVLTIESEGETHEFGKPYDIQTDGYSWPLSAKLTVKEENFWVRMLLHADFGFADAFMLGEIEVDKLCDIFKIFVLNRKSVGELSTLLSPIIRAISYIANLRLANGVTGSKSNISAHYDLSNDFFAAFLSWDLTYSCSIFDEDAKGLAGDLIEPRPIAPPRRSYNDVRTIEMDDLERGQMAKLHLIAQRAHIKPGSRVLEIGCGWGSFAILAAGTYGATVDSITISDEQKVAVDKNIADANLSHAITVHVMDYRQLPEHFHNAFDAVVSIGVMEHVGIEFMKGWFDKISWAMKPEGSFKVFTMTTVPDTRWNQYSTEVDFLRKYIYPGGQLSSVKTLVNDITAAGLNIESIENIGPHYPRTLREWGYRFDRNFDSHIRPALLKQHPQLSEEDILIFQRKWQCVTIQSKMATKTNKYIETVNYHYAKRALSLSALERILNGGQELLSRTQWTPLRNFGMTILAAKLTVKEENFWVRMLLHADFGFADAFMLGEIEVDKLKDIFKIFVLNRKSVGELGTLLSPIVRAISYMLANGLTGSKSNISAHYDLSNDVFAAFLSWDLTYSCGIFDEEAKGAVGDLIEPRPIAPPRNSYNDVRTIEMDDLERSQMAKLHLIAQRAHVKPGSRVLEIGCGWGSFAILAAGTYGATVEAITISDEQKVAIDKNIADANLSHAVTVHVMDYRQMPEHFHNAFDAVVSIGVMEHVGIEYMKGWFDKMSWAMKPEGSFKVFTMSTVPDTRWNMYSTEVDFVRKYIYPGGQLSSVKTLVNDITAAGLNVESIENIGPHYARTLREWGYRFDRNFESHIRPALLKQYPHLGPEDILIFQRKWQYYFAYSEAGFALRSISDHVFTVTREANLGITSTCEEFMRCKFPKSK
ncbi:hypothetical protein CVT24_001692 [Panaeolus cyanescens]|uniref:Polyketide synthase methyltransferase domain-containing protein n=1 Tax=Panaeolus cyanescens TaxID=181874 RepID=A0A409YFK3_9AGAR|nr:hypothetical protein CVT24_001692 [Panaeolus cyanescens]